MKPTSNTACQNRPFRRNPESAEEAAHDRTLVARFNDGDETAFLEIMERYQGRILTLAQQLLKNSADAEEIAQDTFIRAHRGLAKFRGDSSLATWLHRIAVNLARNRYWYFFRRRRHDSLSLDRPLGEESDATFSDLVATGEADPGRDAVNSEFGEMIATCMSRLDTQHREILAMRSAQDLSYDEIADKLRINVGTVKSRIARARERLRALLAECAPEFGDSTTPSDFLLAPQSVRGSILGLAAA